MSVFDDEGQPAASTGEYEASRDYEVTGDDEVSQEAGTGQAGRGSRTGATEDGVRRRGVERGRKGKPAIEGSAGVKREMDDDGNEMRAMDGDRKEMRVFDGGEKEMRQTDGEVKGRQSMEGVNELRGMEEIAAMNPVQYLKGRGAQFNPKNRFLKNETVKEHIEAIDEWIEPNVETQYLEESAKGIVNKVDSPDVGMFYSMNPYQGCEHGCTYCYARNVHEYWGYSAGLDFERKIIVKKNAPQLLRKFLMNPKWECLPISLSGNTDCYQPAEKKFGITRALLEVCLEFNQPVGIITKNVGILRDKDILQKLAEKKLVSVLVSITSFDEELRRVMEPRTTTGKQRLRTIKELSDAGVRMGVMLGPMIPGLNEHEMQRIMKAASENGATFSAYTFIRLNGAIKLIFHDWLYKTFPDRADKVWHLIEASHDGKVNDSRFGVRMRGEGNIAELVAQQYARYTQKYGLNAERWELDTTKFMRPGGQMKMF